MSLLNASTALESLVVKTCLHSRLPHGTDWSFSTGSAYCTHQWEDRVADNHFLDKLFSSRPRAIGEKAITEESSKTTIITRGHTKRLNISFMMVSHALPTPKPRRQKGCPTGSTARKASSGLSWPRMLLEFEHRHRLLRVHQAHL